MSTDIRMFGFSTGEVSPSVKYRSDIDKYLGSCRKLKNFDVDVSGSIARRRGLEFWTDSDSFGIGAYAGQKKFYYSGIFGGQEIFISFSVTYDSTSDVHSISASFCRLGEHRPLFASVDWETAPSVNFDEFDLKSVRFAQYNDVLFVCGRGLSPFEVRFTPSSSVPSYGYVYDSRDETLGSLGDYSVIGFTPDMYYYSATSLGKSSIKRTAKLSDSAIPSYSWTYKKRLNPVDPEITPWGTYSNTSEMLIYILPGRTFYSGNISLIGNNDGSLTVSIGYSASSDDSEDISHVEIAFQRSYFSFNYSAESDTGTNMSWTFPRNEDSKIPATASNMSFDFAVPCAIRYKYRESGEWSEVVYRVLRFKNEKYETISVESPVTLPSFSASARAFPFTVPPTLATRDLNGAPFRYTGSLTRIDFPTSGLAEYDENIPLDAIVNTPIFMLEDTSGESHYVDWGKWTSSGAESGAKSAGATSDIYYASGNTTLYFFSSGGRWCGQLALEVSYDSPSVSNASCSWIQVGAITAATDGTLSPAVSFKVNHHNARVRVRLLERSAAYHYFYEEKADADDNESKSYVADMGCKWTLRISGNRRYYFSHSVYPDNTDYLADVVPLTVCPSTFTAKRYSVGAFCDYYGYPLTLGIAQQRLWFFSTDSNPKAFWASKTNDIANFATGSEKTDGLNFEADFGVPDVGRWFKFGKGQFQFGCAMSEGNLVGKDNELSLNPTSLSLENESAWGSADADSVLIGDKIFYIKAGGRGIFAQVYDSGRARFVSGEVNVLARHLFPVGQRAVKIVGVRAPESVLFVLREDGTICRFIFNDEQNVGAWSWYSFDGLPDAKAIDIHVLNGSDRDRLVVCLKMNDHTSTIRGTLAFCKIGILDPLSSVFTDFETSYESEVITSALPLDTGAAYGTRVSVPNVDLYGRSDSEVSFDVSIDGGQVYQPQNSYRPTFGIYGYFSKLASCRKVSWQGGVMNEVSIGVRTSANCAFELFAVGAEIVARESAAPRIKLKETEN